MSARIVVATYARKTRVFHALHTTMMVATNPSRMMVQMMSFRFSIRTCRLAQSPPRSLQHSVQSPQYRMLSFAVSFFMQCQQRPVIPAAISLITLIWILQSFLSVFIRERRIDFLLAGFAQHFRIPFVQRHLTTTVEALPWCFHVTPPPRAAEPSDADSGRPCRRVSSRRRSNIRMTPVRFACRASA